ncbi:MAG: hypothetical protein ACXVKH_04590 [Candidatus Angelobacter sp.]
MHTLQQCLTDLSKACRHGSKLPLVVSYSEKMLNEQLHDAVKANLPVFDRVYMDKCEKAYSQGFEAAIAGKLDLSRKAFELAETILASKPLFYESRLLCKAFLLASEAYLDYSLKEFNSARDRLMEAIQCDEILETQFSYRILHIHRVHLVENLMRLEFHAGRKSEAFALAHSLLLYLGGIAPALSISGAWGQELLSKVAPEVVCMKFAGITTDVAQFLAPLSTAEAREFFSVSALCFESCNHKYCPPAALEWFVIKRTFCDEQYLNFLSQASECLARGPQATPGLWSAIALDAISACDALFPEAEATKREILADAMNWGFIPRKLKALFASKAANLQMNHSSANA